MTVAAITDIDVSALDVAFHKGWLTLWFNQPETRNAMTAALMDDLTRVLIAARDTKSVRGITLRGRNGVFCSGGDLKSFQSNFQAGNTKDDILAMSRESAAIFDLINTMPQVVVCLIEGAAMAGGFGMACCADVVICHSEARFAMTETMIGLCPAQISPFVIKKLGYATARRLMLTAARFDGTEAQTLGFADITGDSVEALEAAEMQIRKQVLKCAPGAVANTKRLIHGMPGLAREDAIDFAAENFASSLLSNEAREGLAAFLTKRKPAWAIDPK